MRRFLLAMSACAAISASATEWQNIDAEHHLGGRKASEGYLQDKVVAVFRWKAGDGASADELLSDFGKVWANFKTKQFVLLGAPVGEGGNDEAVRRQLKQRGVSYPVYRNAGLKSGEPACKSLPTVYVTDETGKIVYFGADARHATQALVTALTDIESPQDLAQWKRFLDYELVNAPCHGYLRLKAFREKFPQAARGYAAEARKLAAIPRLKAMADFVAFARKAKDPPVFGPRDGAKKRKYRELVGNMISNGEALKDHPDPRVAREVKNALADLKWTQVEF